jgi:hypothetical protein
MNNLETEKFKKDVSCKLVIVENFYENPLEVRTFALKQNFISRNYHPGKRTKSFATIDHRKIFQSILKPFGGDIIKFETIGDNGSFQIATSYDRSWVHIDSCNNWAAVVYLTPDAPLSSGTGFFQFHDGTLDGIDQIILNNENITSASRMDLTKWKLVDNAANIFNRIIFYRSNNFHMSMDYFGKDIYDGRLFQVFFFSTEY